jgi:uncharacterized membrane protein YdbT with pleckstrin-like domain
MAKASGQWRNSGRYVLAEYVRRVPQIIIVPAVMAWLYVHIGSVSSALAWAVIGLVLVDFVLGPVYHWANTTYQVTSSEVTMDQGFVFRRVTVVRLDHIRSVDVDADWVLRLFGLSRLTVWQTGQEPTRIEFRGLTRSVLDEVAQALHDGRPAEADREPGAGPVQPAAEPVGALLYQASVRDVVTLAFVQGRILVLAPAALLGAWDEARSFGVDQQVAGWLGSLGLLPLAGLAVLAVLVLGVAQTIVRYHGFTVTAAEGSALRLSYGLVRLRQRVIYPSAVMGLVIRRNWLELWTGRGSLSVLTLDSSARLGTNTVLPSVPWQVLCEVVSAHFPNRSITLYVGGQRLRQAMRAMALVLLAAGVPAIALIGLRAARRPWWLAIAVALVAYLLARRLLVVLGSRLVTDPVHALASLVTHSVANQQLVVDGTALHGLSVWSIGQADEKSVRRLVSGFLYCGRPRRLAAIRCSLADVELIRTYVTASRPVAGLMTGPAGGPGVGPSD